MAFNKFVPVNFIILALTLVSAAQDLTPPETRPTEIVIDETATLEIVGFGDLLTTFKEEKDGNTFNIGQAEIDLESDLKDNITMALAIAYDDGAFGIGAFTVDWTAWELDENTPSPFQYACAPYPSRHRTYWEYNKHSVPQ